jgi:hypothetical protein
LAAGKAVTLIWGEGRIAVGAVLAAAGNPVAHAAILWPHRQTDVEDL